MIPLIPFPIAVGLAALAVAAQAWFWRRTALRGLPKVVVLLLRLAAIAMLAWIVTGPEVPILVPSETRWPVVLTDISDSMEFPGTGGSRAEQADSIVRMLSEQASNAGRTKFLSFGTRLVMDTTVDDSGAVRAASLPATALRSLLAPGPAASVPLGILLISDGAAQDASDLPAVAKACRDRGVPVSVLCTGSGVAVRNASLAAVDAPRRAKAGTVVPVTVTARRLGIESPLVVELLDEARQVVAATTVVHDTAEPTGTVHLTVGAAGFSGSVRIAPTDGEMTLADNETPLRITAEDATLRVLYMEGSLGADSGLPEPVFLCQALSEHGDIEVDLLCPQDGEGGIRLAVWPWKSDEEFVPDPSRSYPATKEELDRYDVVICSDIQRTAFTDDQIRWTVDLVAERGGGFLMIGGVTSFGAGMWDRTPWEKLIPLDMDDFSRGFVFNAFQVHWTEAGKRHPLLAQLPLEDGETLDTILDAHPLLHGTNLIRRAKPAAAVLMRMNGEEGAPIIAVQPFGKGRTMAFASDITAQWGTDHNRAWGPQDGRDPASPFNNGYYRRFWQRAIRWLAENSIRAKGPRFELTTTALEWVAERPLPLFAAGPDEGQMSRVADLPCTVQVRGMPDTRTRLAWDAAARRFTGSMPRPPGLQGEAVIEAQVRDPLTRTLLTGTLAVLAPRDDPERASPSARPDLLTALAAESGGAVLHSATEAAEWLANGEKASMSPDAAGRKPAWDHAWVLALILVLLSADWAIRRVSA